MCVLYKHLSNILYYVTRHAGAVDIVDGNEKLTLAIVNELIQHFQIHFGSSTSDAANNRRSPLLAWFSTILPPDCQPTNLTTAWGDGRSLTALVNYYKPGVLPDATSLDPDVALENVTNAMDVAEKELNVYKVLQPEDVVVEKPEEFMMMTYLSSFCSPGSIGQLHLLRWVKSFLPTVRVTNLSSDWSDGSTLCALVNALAPSSSLPVKPDGIQPAVEVIKAALDVAEKELGVKPKYSAEEIYPSEENDQIKLMVYLAQLQSLGKEPLFSPKALSAEGTGIEGVQVNSDATFTINGESSALGDFTIVITSPDGSLVDFDVVPSSGSTSPHYHYKPNTAGVYTVDISVFGEPIKGSPYHVIHSDPLLAERCFVTTEKVIRGKLNHPMEFVVDCSEAGFGKLSAVVENPEKEQVQNITITPAKTNGQYQVKFIPDVVGSHNAYISWNGNPIKYSPHVCRVSDPDGCIASGPGLSHAILGHPTTFEVDTFHSGPGNLTAEIYGPSHPVKVKLTSQVGSVYHYQYIPLQPGTHHIEVKWDGFQIGGSPFTVHPKEPTIASSCFVREMPNERSAVNRPISLVVDATQSGEAELEAVAQGPSTEEKCEIICLQKGVYSVTFYPKEVGEYALEISYGGSAIPDSPLHFSVNDPSKCIVHLDAKKQFSVDKIVSFQVSTFDAGEGNLLAIVSSQNEEFLCNVVDGGNGDYTVSFSPKEIGKHDIMLRFDGKTFLDSPLSVHVDSKSLSDIVISKPALSKNTQHYLVNQLIEISMYAPDRDATAFEVSGIGTEMGAQPVLVLEPEGDHNYTIKFQAAIADDYKIDVKYRDSHLPQSPLVVMVRNPPCATKVLSFDPVIPLTYGKAIELVFDTSQAGEGGMENLTADIVTDSDAKVMYSVEAVSPDLYRMVFLPRMEGVYTVNVFWHDAPINGSPFTIEFKEQVKKPQVTVQFEPDLDYRSILTASAVGQNTATELEVQVQQVERGKYQISFSPESKDIFQLQVKMFGQEIKGSPFEIDLLSPGLKKLPEVEHIESVMLDLLTTGEGVLSAYVEGRQSGVVPVQITLGKEQGKASLRFEDKKNDIYTLYVYWNDRLVRGAPFELDLSI